MNMTVMSASCFWQRNLNTIYLPPPIIIQLIILISHLVNGAARIILFSFYHNHLVYSSDNCVVVCRS
jgi:hypothetical protein